MTTLERPKTDTDVTQEPLKSRWLVIAVVVFMLASVAFATLWMLERGDVSDLEDSVSAVESELADSEAALALVDAELADANEALALAQAELAASVTEAHPSQAGAEDLFNRLVTAISDPNAAEIAALFTASATHTPYELPTITGAEAIGEGFESFGPISFTADGSPVLSGQEFEFTAVLPGTAFDRTGFLVATIGVHEGEFRFKDLNWYAP